MNTPWGKSDYKETYTRGFHWVSTPGHGGLALSKALARKVLSSKAIALADIEQGGYIFFEEDCAYAVPLYENDALRDAHDAKRTNSIPLTKEALRNTIARWFPKYFELG